MRSLRLLFEGTEQTQTCPAQEMVDDLAESISPQFSGHSDGCISHNVARTCGHKRDLHLAEQRKKNKKKIVKKEEKKNREPKNELEQAPS